MLYSGLDLFKFLFAIIVIAIHTQPFANQPDMEACSFYRMLCDAAVPFFFICSGFLLGIKLNKGNDLEDSSKHRLATIKSYLRKNVRMYVLWTLIYFPLAIYGFHLDNLTWLHAVIVYIKNIILLGENYNSWPLWYLLSTIYCTIFLLLFHKKNLKTILLAGFLFFAFGEFITYYMHHHEEGVFYLAIAKTIESGRLFKGFLYIPLGMFLSQSDRRISPYLLIAALVISATAFSFANELSGSFILIFFVTALFLLVKELRPTHPVYFILRKLSTYTYLLHMWVFSIITYLLFGQSTYGGEVFTYTLIGTLVLSLIVVLWQRKRGDSSPRTHTESPRKPAHP